jgi:hypothetical protein
MTRKPEWTIVYQRYEELLRQLKGLPHNMPLILAADELADELGIPVECGSVTRPASI